MTITSGNNDVNVTNVATGLAMDAASLNTLKQAVRKDPNSPGAIRGVAKQFEALFVNMMVQSMRKATLHYSPFDSEQTKMFTEMLDQQMSQTLAQRGVGLADLLTRQLSKGIAVDRSRDDSMANDSAAAVAKSAEIAGALPLGIASLPSRRAENRDNGA